MTWDTQHARIFEKNLIEAQKNESDTLDEDFLEAITDLAEFLWRDKLMKINENLYIGKNVKVDPDVDIMIRNYDKINKYEPILSEK